MNTDNSVVKSGCEEKEGNGTVSGGGCTFIQEFCSVGFSGSQRACLFAEGIDLVPRKLGLQGRVEGFKSKVIESRVGLTQSTSEGVGIDGRKELEGRLRE